jgi:hypothetical protein
MKNLFAKDWRLCEQIMGCDSEGVFTRYYTYETTSLTWFEAIRKTWKDPENMGYPYGIYIRHVAKLEHYIPRKELPEIEVQRGESFLSRYLENQLGGESIRVAKDDNPELKKHDKSLNLKFALAGVLLASMLSLGVYGFIAKYPYRIAGACKLPNSILFQDEDCMRSKMGDLKFRLADTGEFCGVVALAVLTLPLMAIATSRREID